jgi:transcriptional regulator with XRE-family HTH domain
MISMEVMKSWIGCECGSGQHHAISDGAITRELKIVTTVVRALAMRVGCSRTMVSWVLSGKRNANTRLGRRIMKLANGTKQV